MPRTYYGVKELLLHERRDKSVGAVLDWRESHLLLTKHIPLRDRCNMTLIDLLLRNFDDLVLAPEAAENPDPAFGDAEMLCQ
jgi:hypothetical protein